MKFQPGKSGNPNGRPIGSGQRQKLFSQLVEPHKTALFDKAIKLALPGNEAMLRLLLERMLPAKPMDEPITLDMPKAPLNKTEALIALGQELLRAVTAGEITPEEATRMGSFIKAHQNTFQLQELRGLFNSVLEKIDGEDKKINSEEK